MLIIGIDPGISGAICFMENGKLTDVIEIYTCHINEDYVSGILIAQDDTNMATFNLDGVSLQAKKINQNFKLAPLKKIIGIFLD